MNKYNEIINLKEYVSKNINVLPKETIESFNEDFDIRFTHESTKIEGNTLTIFEVKTLLVDNLSIAGKNLREIYEVVNNQKAFNYIKKAVKQKRFFTEELIKDLHQIITENIIDGGIYRNINVRISGASFYPPDWTVVRNEMNWFIDDYNINETKMNPIELASWVHAKFVKIHPFPDGNGRTARLLLNFILMKNNFLPIIIKSENRPAYYSSLDKFSTVNDLNAFYNLILDEEFKALNEIKSEIENHKNKK